MDSSIFFGGSVVAAVVAGVIALFAPCCISVMLPAYFASSFPNRRMLVAVTFLFAAGVATVVLPIALGASLVRQLLVEQHTPLYIGGGVLMLALAGYVLLGGKVHLPMPGRRASGRTGVLGVYTLGIFSGIASSCCAPVLAGVIALSSVAASFGLALGLGVAYVFGMVAPLFVIALLWERLEPRVSGLFRPRSITWQVGSLRRTLTLTDLASGVLLVLIGAGMVWIGVSGSSMPALTGWQAQLTAWLSNTGSAITRAFAWLPGWLAAIILAVALFALARRAMRQLDGERAHPAAGAAGDQQDQRKRYETGDALAEASAATTPHDETRPRATEGAGR